jgi:hypothetical protein
VTIKPGELDAHRPRPVTQLRWVRPRA